MAGQFGQAWPTAQRLRVAHTLCGSNFYSTDEDSTLPTPAPVKLSMPGVCTEPVQSCFCDSGVASMQMGQANCSMSAGCAWQLDYSAQNPYNGFCYNATATAACQALGSSMVACETLRDPATNLQMCNVQQAR